MNVFSDFHQSSLYYSLQLLFEKRLGYNLFRPIGMEWYTEGYWAIYPSQDTAEQYLGMRQGYQPKDGTLPLNDSSYILDGGGEIDYHLCDDKHNNTTNKAITFDVFKQIPIDIVIASIPQHIEPYKKLAQMKGAKFIFQMGNVFNVQPHEITNLMANTLPPHLPTHYIQYHQEFPLDVFKPRDISSKKQIISFINVYQDNGGFEDYVSLKGLMTDYDFKSYGGQCQDGSIGSISEMASIMQESAWGFHSKRMGDGYGHVLYNWFACGKPVITRISDYKGKLGEELLEDRVTCLDLDKHDYNVVQSIISDMSPKEYTYMCQQAYQRFTSKVDFGAEEIKIRKFLNELR